MLYIQNTRKPNHSDFLFQHLIDLDHQTWILLPDNFHDRFILGVYVAIGFNHRIIAVLDGIHYLLLRSLHEVKLHDGVVLELGLPDYV